MKNNYPKSRTDEIVVQELNGEILVYDLRDNRAMCLNETSSAVWRACDGSNSVADIAARVGNEDIVWLALDQLKKEKLVDNTPESNRFDGMSRREVIKKIGMGTAVALPIIAGLVAPPAASAVSCGATCRTVPGNPSQNIPCTATGCLTCNITSGTTGICVTS